MYLCTRYIALLIEAAHASRDQIQCRHVLQLWNSQLQLLLTSHQQARKSPHENDSSP